MPDDAERLAEFTVRVQPKGTKASMGGTKDRRELGVAMASVLTLSLAEEKHQIR